MEANSQRETVALVTGATSGLGLEIARTLAKEGFKVYGTGRNPKEPAVGGAPALRYLPMNLGDQDSIEAAVQTVLTESQALDVLVACAGFGVAGSVERTGREAAALQMDANFLGTAMTVRSAVAAMRSRGGGKIIIVGSLAGRIGMPFQAYYSASKFALEGFVESLRYEVHGLGIQVCVLEPGDFSTGFTSARRKIEGEDSPYYSLASRVIGKQEKDETNGAEPRLAARAVMALLKRRKLPVRKSVGPLFQRFASAIKPLVPSSLFEKMYKLYYGIR